MSCNGRGLNPCCGARPYRWTTASGACQTSPPSREGTHNRPTSSNLPCKSSPTRKVIQYAQHCDGMYFTYKLEADCQHHGERALEFHVERRSGVHVTKTNFAANNLPVHASKHIKSTRADSSLRQLVWQREA